MPSSAFQTAVGHSKQISAKPDNDELLQLYAYYKQATQDPPIEKAEQPGMFDMKGKAKKKAWEKVVSDGVTPTQAEGKYVELVEQLKGKYGFDASKKPEAVGSGS